MKRRQVYFPRTGRRCYISGEYTLFPVYSPVFLQPRAKKPVQERTLNYKEEPKQ